MTDYSNQKQSSTEYELKGEGEAGGSEQPFAGMGVSEPSRPMDKFKPILKKLALPVGIIVSVLILYAFLSWSSGGGKEKATSAQVIVPKKEATATPEVVSQPTFTQAVPSAQPVISQSQIANMVSGELARSQGALQNKLDDLAGQIASNRDQINNLSTSIDQNKQDIATINQNISNIVNTLQDVVKTLQKLTAPKKPKKVAKKAVAPKQYHVKAIVPGRAWLESSDGNLITLRVGDKLEGYGTIELISPRQGLVVTSTGAQIQYGVNDI